MNSGTTWPRYLLDRAASAPPPDCNVISGSTPIVSFGDPVAPSVATLGINPAQGAFIDDDGRLLSGQARKHATLPSLGVATREEITPELAATIVDECAAYFLRPPQHPWFGPLDRILKPALGFSYSEGSVSHLDLVQWATYPMWGLLDDSVQRRLVDADAPFLQEQFKNCLLYTSPSPRD